jgi:hypothetical protein
MILFLITGRMHVFMLALLLLLVYLAWIELRNEPESLQVKLWWLSVVLLGNVLGYLALRVWLVGRRRKRQPA